jgi:outer membrane protein OmpA-like peptidoglycan-associated protein
LWRCLRRVTQPPHIAGPLAVNYKILPMRYFQIIISALLIIFLSKSVCVSQSLIANGSFEDENVCTEFNAKCAPEAWMTASPFIPLYGGKTNKSVAFEIFNTSVPNTRKYIQTKLLCPLIKDKKYRFSLKMSASTAQVESIGALFSDSIFFFERDVLIKIKPTIDFSSQMLNIPKKKRSEWNHLTVDFIATGFEKYLIIGNFQTDSEQNRTFLDKPTPFKSYYYMIDDVELIPVDSIELCPDYEINKEKLYNLNDRHTIIRSKLFDANEKQISTDIEITQTIDTIRFSNILFAFDSHIINPDGKHLLDSLFSRIDKGKIDFVKIQGHTDSVGDHDYNIVLSLNRAKAISNYLSIWGISDKISEIQGFGDQYPLESNSTENGRQINRRVEIIIKYIISR